MSCNSDFVDAADSCGDGAVAGVICPGRTVIIIYVFNFSYVVDTCENGAVRLAGANTDATNVGRVELCVENAWTTLCDQSWDHEDAQVVCRQLGFSSYGLL